ncbi:hypothetical protein Dimus_004381, partial [Dionaea muscipula]
QILNPARQFRPSVCPLVCPPDPPSRFAFQCALQICPLVCPPDLSSSLPSSCGLQLYSSVTLLGYSAWMTLLDHSA